MAKVPMKIIITVDAEKQYDIEIVAFLLGGYDTGYVRDLERAGKIPKAHRDEKNWRYWLGKDIPKILEYTPNHNAQKNNLNKGKKKK